MIMRYKTIYSILLMFWIFISSFTINHNILSKVSLLIVLPSTLSQIICFYIANLKEPIYEIDFYNKDIYGFILDFQFIELEYSIMILYFTLHIAYAKQVFKKKKVIKTFQSQMSVSQSQIKQNSLDILSIKDNREISSVLSNKELRGTYKEKDDKQVNFLDILVSIIGRYSDIISLFSLFWISLYTVNLMHLILAFFFLLFSIQMGTSLSSNSKNEDDSLKTNYSFVRKFWVFLIIYVNLIIFLRYLWVVLIIPYCGEEYKNYPGILFAGITYDYHISPSIGLVTEGT